MTLIGRIGNYEIVKHLGSGAMGDVYQATDAEMFGRLVAIKLLSEKLTGNETAQERFNREIEVATQLEHENIVTIFGRGVHDGRMYFVMEFIDGEDLHSLIRNTESRTIEEKLDIARQICEALEFAHSHGVVHRDIKPSNIMVARRANRDQIKLLDFGIVHVKRSNLTRVTTQPGTYSYMSPEQVRNSELDYRSDLFSLGIVLYELFTGLHPFASSSEVRIAARIDQDEPEPPRKSTPDLPSQLDTIILRLLEKDPAQRPQSAGSVAEALRGVIRKLTRGATSDHSDFTNLDEMTQGMVTNLLTWGRQKEAEGNHEEALRTYQTATQLAPDSDLVKGKVSKLKHRIEIDKKLRLLLAQAAEALAAGRIGEARSRWNDAWLLAPDAEDVVELEASIRKTEVATPDDHERMEFVATGIAAAESALDRGDLTAAFSELRGIRTRYPDEDRATTLWNLVVTIRTRQIPYKEFRVTLKEAQAAVVDRRFSAAKESLAKLKELWPDAAEVAVLESEIGDSFGSAVRQLVAEAEALVKEAKDSAKDPVRALAVLATALGRLDQARELGADDGWISEPRTRAVALQENLTGAAVALDAALSRARDLLKRAEASKEKPDRDPKGVLAGFVEAQEAFGELIASFPGHAEATDALARIGSEIEALREESEQKAEVTRLNAEAIKQIEGAVARARQLARGSDTDLELCLDQLETVKGSLHEVLGRTPSHDAAMRLNADVDRLFDQVRQTQRERQEAQDEKKQAALRQVAEGLRQGREQLARIQAAPRDRLPDLRTVLELFPEVDASVQAALAIDPSHSELQTLKEELSALHQELLAELARKDRVFRGLLVEGRSRLPKLDTIATLDKAAIEDALVWLEAAREPIDGAIELDPSSSEALELSRMRADGVERANQRMRQLEAPPPAPPPHLKPKPEPPPPPPQPESLDRTKASALVVEARRRYDDAKLLENELESQADRIVELLDPARKGVEEALRLSPRNPEASVLRDQIARLLKAAKPKAHTARTKRAHSEFRTGIKEALALAQAGPKRRAREAYTELDRRGRAHEELHSLLPELEPLAAAIKGGAGLPWKATAAGLGLLVVAVVVVRFGPWSGDKPDKKPSSVSAWQVISKKIEPPTSIPNMSDAQVGAFVKALTVADTEAQALSASDSHRESLLETIKSLRQECSERRGELAVATLPARTKIMEMDSEQQLNTAQDAIDQVRSKIDGLSNSKSFGRWTALVDDRAGACQERRTQIAIPPVVETETDPQIEGLLARARNLIPAKGLGGFGDNQLELVRQNLASAQVFLDRVRQLDPSNARAGALQKQLNKGQKELKQRSELLASKSNAEGATKDVKTSGQVQPEEEKPVVPPMVTGAKGTFCDPDTHKPLSPGPFKALRRPDGTEFPGTIGANGEYELPLEAGRYVFSIIDSKGTKRDARMTLINPGEVVMTNPFPCEK